MTATALVVDDEADLCRLMQMTLTKMGIKSDVAYNLATANEYLDKSNYDFCLTDLKLPDGSGLELVKRISMTSSTPIAVITAHGSMDLAIEALKLGAFDFVNKPLELPRLRQLVENALKVAQQVSDANSSTQQTPELRMLDERLIGNSPAMAQLKTTIVKLARSQAPVFLWGASGTGKEVVARLIHDLSPRREGHFVPVNCGAIPSELMESEFFGHKKGSFTGANTDKMGLFQQANGGTLFLDEVADLPLAMQVKLLRAIQEKTIRAIGDTKEVSVDVRILSATHKDLAQLVQQGSFRQDLFYRINVIELKLPTLNERGDDIPALAKHFLTLIAQDWQLDKALDLSPAACEALKNHDFEGNVRELRNLLERAVTLADSHIIDVDHLGIMANEAPLHPQAPIDTIGQSSTPVNISKGITQSLPQSSSAYCYFDHSNQYTTAINQSITTTASAQPHAAQELPSQGKQPQTQHLQTNLAPDPTNQVESNSQLTSTELINHAHHADSANTTNDNNTSLESAYSHNGLPKEGLEAYLQEQEKALIITALNQTDWNKTKAAKLLGTTFRSLRYRMKKLEIDEDEQSD